MFLIEIDWPGKNLPFYFDKPEDCFNKACFFTDQGYTVIFKGEVQEEDGNGNNA